VPDLFQLNSIQEFELWLNGLLAFNRQSGVAFGSQKAILPNSDFREEVRTTLQVVESLLGLCQSISTMEINAIREESPNFTFPPDKDLRQVMRQYRSLTHHVRDFITFWEYLEHQRVLCTSLIRLPTFSRREFKAFGAVVSGQITRFFESEAWIYMIGRFRNWDLHNLLERDILVSVEMEGVREQMQLVFEEFCNILGMLAYLDEQQRQHFKYKKLMILFMYSYFRCRKFLKLLSETAKYLDHHQPDLAEMVQGTILALKMEMRRVFSCELRDLDSRKKIDLIYGQMQTALGLLLNAYQQSFISLVHMLNPHLDEFELFESLPRRYRESLQLLADLEELYQLVRDTPSKQISEERWRRIRHSVDLFRNTSMKFLFFRDWAAFEQTSEELELVADPAERPFLLHKFEVYVSTLIGEVQKRAVLQRVEKDDLQASVG
jgi:hypothetical protein